MTLLVVTVVFALAFDFTNGFHDTANAVATSVSTRALSPRLAVLVAAVANLGGAFATTAVAKTVGKGIIDSTLATEKTVLAAVVVALTAPSPLSVSIASVHTTGQLATVGQVTLAVRNNTGGSVRPAFTVENGTTMTAFWKRASGPAVLGPHQQASYTIVAPSYFAMPSIQNGFQVLAFVSDPASVSMCAASESSASEPASRPIATSASMNVTISASATSSGLVRRGSAVRCP